MLKLVLLRIATMIPTVVAIAALLFFSVSTLLGSPAAIMLGEDASPQAIAALNAKYGFDRPAWQQFLSWAGAALQGDLGRSYTTQESVAKAVLACLPVTLELTVLSIVLAAGAAIACNTVPVGRRLIAPTVTAVNLIGITVPNFMLGVTLILLFSVGLGWLPSTGWVPWSDGAGTHLAHMILPVLTLSAYYFGVFSIVYRAEYRDVSGRMFMRAARAKGLGEWAVAFRHAMPNAALPLITFVGISMGQLTGGAVVTETIFSMPGTGRLFVGAIAGHDFPVMLAVGMLIVVGVVLMNLIADLAYTVVNPLISAGLMRRWIGGGIVLAAVAVAVLAPMLAPHDPLRSGVEMLDLPSCPHPLGTDDLGRDILSRVIYGARTSLAIGIGAACVAMGIGVPLGLSAGYLRGRLDVLIVALIDLFIALPGLVLALIITAMVGPTLRNLILVLGFVMWPAVARLVRGQALAIRETPFVEAARAAGGSPPWIIRRHVWPNVVRVAAPQFAVTVAFAIFTSASLSFLGLGIPPPTPDWGGMVRTGYDYLSINPFMSLGPGAAVTLTVMGFYVAGASFK